MKSVYKTSGLMFLTILLLSCKQLSAQTLKDFFNSSDVPLTYLGVDFTQAKVLNELTILLHQTSTTSIIRLLTRWC